MQEPAANLVRARLHLHIPAEAPQVETCQNPTCACCVAWVAMATARAAWLGSCVGTCSRMAACGDPRACSRCSSSSRLLFACSHGDNRFLGWQHDHADITPMTLDSCRYCMVTV